MPQRVKSTRESLENLVHRPHGYSGSEAWRIFIFESRSCPLFLPTVVHDHALEFSRSPCKWAGKKGLKTQEQSRTKGRISISEFHLRIDEQSTFILFVSFSPRIIVVIQSNRRIFEEMASRGIRSLFVIELRCW